MKFNTKNVKHWIIFSWSIFILLIAAIYTRKRKPHRNIAIVFYGHKLNGNLLPLYNHWSSRKDVDVYFITLDKNYYNIETSRGMKVLLATRIKDIFRISRADVFISDHGIHHFSVLRKITDMVFIHVLHGIPYKGYDEKDFEHLHKHDQIWVSSESMAKMHIERFGFSEDQVRITGFARTEEIGYYTKNKTEIIKKYGLDLKKKTILVAPTWKQDDNNRSIVPFGLNLGTFMDILLNSSKRDVQVIFRSHLNTEVKSTLGKLKNVFILPYSQYPVAEEFLAVSDVLITDWSSIGFDFLVTERPIIYLDVESPFKKGHSVSSKYRPGRCVGSSEQLAEATSSAIDNPGDYNKQHEQIIAETTDYVYGSTLDGKILERSDRFLFEALSKKKDAHS